VYTESSVGAGGCRYSQAVDNSLPMYSEVVLQRTVGSSLLAFVRSLLLSLLCVCVNFPDADCMMFSQSGIRNSSILSICLWLHVH